MWINHHKWDSEETTVDLDTHGLHILELSDLEYKTMHEIFEKWRWTLKVKSNKKLIKYDNTAMETNQ